MILLLHKWSKKS